MLEAPKLSYLSRVHQVHDELIKKCNRHFTWIIVISLVTILISTDSVGVDNQISVDTLKFTIELNKLIICLSIMIAYMHQTLYHMQAKAAKSYSWLLELYNNYNMTPNSSESNIRTMMQFVLPYFFYEHHTISSNYSDSKASKCLRLIHDWGFRLLFNWLPLMAILAGLFKIIQEIDSVGTTRMLVLLSSVVIYELINVIIWLGRSNELNIIRFENGAQRIP